MGDSKNIYRIHNEISDWSEQNDFKDNNNVVTTIKDITLEIVWRIITDPRITVRKDQLLWLPSDKIISELPNLWYEYILNIWWYMITKWLSSKLKPYYYIPHILIEWWKFVELNKEIIEYLSGKMNWADEDENIEILSEVLDFPVDVLIYMMNDM